MPDEGSSHCPEDLPIPPVKGGSVQIYLHELAKRLRNHAQVIVISPASKRQGGRLPGVTYRSVGRVHASGDYIRPAAQVARRLGCDVIQIDNRPKFVPYIRRACPGVPVVLNLHSMNFLHPRSISTGAARKALAQTPAINTVSQSLRSRVIRRFPGVKQRVRTIYAGVNRALQWTACAPEGRRPADRHGADLAQGQQYSGAVGGGGQAEPAHPVRDEPACTSTWPTHSLLRVRLAHRLGRLLPGGRRFGLPLAEAGRAAVGYSGGRLYGTAHRGRHALRHQRVRPP